MRRPGTSQIKFRPLTRTLTLVTLGLSVFILVGISGAQLYLSYKSQKLAIAGQQQVVAQSAGNAVKVFVQQKISILQATTKLNSPLQVGQSDQLQILDKLISLEPSFNRVGLVNTQRRETSISIRLADVNSKIIDDRVNQDQLFNTVKQGKTYISSVYISNLTNEPLILIAVPVKDVFGNFLGTLAAETNLKFMWDLVGSIKVGDHGLAYVVDKQGKLIAFGDPSRALKGENLSGLREVKQFMASNGSTKDNGTDISTGINKTRVVSTYTALGTPDWAVVTEVPVLEAYHNFIQGAINLFLVIILGSTFAVLASAWIAKWMTKPLLSLRNAAREIGSGNLATRISVKANNEIGELAQAFNEMAEGLQQSNRALHSEQAKLRASIESLSVGFMLADNEDQLITRNLAINKIMDLDPSAPFRLKDLKAKLSSSPEILKAFQKAEDADKIFEVKNVPYGSKILRIFMSPVMINEQGMVSKLGTVVLVENVTEERVLERSKDEFFSIASHELRTPLTAIKGNTSMIMDYYGDQLKDPTLKDMVSDIHGSSIRLIEIVNDFLDASRLEQGKMIFKPQEFDIDKVVESVVYEMKAVLEEKNLYLTVDTHTLGNLPKVWADPDRTKQVIYNLIGNAAKFTEKGGITINVLHQNNFLKVLVTDTGRGISPEGQALLFHKFQQTGDSLLTRDTTRGTGLGLYISKMIVEKMGGTMQLEHSQISKGTTFSFTLPIATLQLKQQLDAKATTDATTGMTVEKAPSAEVKAAATKAVEVSVK